MRFHLTIKAATVSDKEAWDNYVLSHSNGITYKLFAWKEVVALETAARKYIPL